MKKVLVVLFVALVCGVLYLALRTEKGNTGNTKPPVLPVQVETATQPAAPAETVLTPPTPVQPPATQLAEKPAKPDNPPDKPNLQGLFINQDWSGLEYLDPDKTESNGKIAWISIGHTGSVEILPSQELRRLGIIEDSRIRSLEDGGRFGWADIGVHYISGVRGIYEGRPLELAGKTPKNNVHKNTLLISVLGTQDLVPVGESKLVGLVAKLLQHYKFGVNKVITRGHNTNVTRWLSGSGREKIRKRLEKLKKGK